MRIWPFKKTPSEEREGYDPNPPCGEPAEHYSWTVVQGMWCPCCARKERKEQERAEQEGRLAAELVRDERLADMIAEKIVQKLREAGL